MRIARFLLAAAIALPALSAQSQSVLISHTTTGSANDWTTNFTFGNNFSDPYVESLYFFGVYMPGASLSGSGPGFSEWVHNATWNDAGYGGPSLDFNANWYGTGINNGQSESGFLVHSTATDAPGADIPWFAFVTGSDYQGADANYRGGNAGFSGLADSAQTAPEPASFVLMATGLIGAFGVARRRAKRA